MEYCIVAPDTNIIENIIVCDNDEIAGEFGALPSYYGAVIGGLYAPPPPPPTELEQLRADVDFLAALQGVTL